MFIIDYIKFLVIAAFGLAALAFAIYVGACFIDHVQEPEVRYHHEGFIPDNM